MKAERLTLQIGAAEAGITAPVKISIFFSDLFEAFPDRPFVVFDDSDAGRGPFLLYPDVARWKEYAAGASLAGNSPAKAREALKRMGRRLTGSGREERYRILLKVIGFLETKSGSDYDALAVDSWKKLSVRRLSELIQLALEECPPFRPVTEAD